jgi:spermidine synthase
MVLPLLGGAPAVWNTCVLFFQASLLAGYAYAHVMPRSFSTRRQPLLHIGLLVLPLAILPIRTEGWVPPISSNPVLWLLVLLLVCAGLPFFVVATSAPLLQNWFAGTGHRAAHDPYFLYAASNVGSLLALASYPFLIEPSLSLGEQSWLWEVGYVLLLILTTVCAALLWRAQGNQDQASVEHRAGDRTAVSRKPTGSPWTGRLREAATRLRWVALAFVPSSLMLGVTTYITTDITPFPLLWVLPLSIYLLTFILVFARLPALVHQVFVLLLPVVISLLVIVSISWFRISLDIGDQVKLHLAVFFVVAMVCHGELAQTRPPAQRLTEFYLWMAVGGVLGGLFNALIAPQVFNRIVEYPLTMALACLLRPHLKFETSGDREERDNRKAKTSRKGDSVGDRRLYPRRLLTVAGTLCWMLFGMGTGAVFYLLSFGGEPRFVPHTERTFFGVLRVQIDPAAPYLIRLAHGTTVHGTQDVRRPAEPLSYYYRGGPIGQYFAAFSGPRAKKNVAVVGLGAGTLAAYAETGQRWTFYEIDPAVERLAYTYFSFLRDCEKRQVTPRIVLGDARLQLKEATEQYDLIILDAFSSDSVPVHLLTREALDVYLRHLTDDGILVFHTSSMYFRLHPILADLADDAGLVCFFQQHLNVSRAELFEGKDASNWVVMARKAELLGPLAEDKRWRRLAGPKKRLWTDDYCNVLGALYWKGRPQD